MALGRKIDDVFTGLAPKAFAAFWALREEAALKQAGIDPLELGRDIEKLLARFPNFRVNADEQRQLRAALYRPLITLLKEFVLLWSSGLWPISSVDIGHAET